MTYPAWAAMGLVLLATVLLPAPTVERIAPYTFLLSLIFLGLPHGAWDHRVIAAAHDTHLTWRHLAVVCAGYSALVAFYGVGWLLAPGPCFLLFIAISWLHWGQGDAAYLRLWLSPDTRTPSRTAPPPWLTWLVRGGAPILLPVFRFPNAFARIASGVTALFGRGQTAAEWLPSPQTRVAGCLFLAAIVAAYLIYLLRAYARGDSASRAAAREDAAEVVFLYGVFAIANPIFAVGVYFCFWHGLRHIGRLLLLDGATRTLCAGRRVPAAFARFGWQCAPILAASLAMLAGVYRWAVYAGGGSGGAATALYVYLALIACLTFPHVLLVCWMDSRRGR